MTKILNENFEEIEPVYFFFEENKSKAAKEIGEVLKRFYLPYEPNDIRSLNSLNNVFAGGVIGKGVH